MDFGLLPPEVNSSRMYSGPGPESMLAAAAAWDGVAAELTSAAVSYGSVVSTLIVEPWMGPAAAAMAAAATPYVGWLAATAALAKETATQARAAAEAFGTAFAMTVPPSLVAANRSRLMSLVAANILGQNRAAIAATQAEYAEMWAQDAAVMYSYEGASAAAATQAAGAGAVADAQATLAQLPPGILSDILSALAANADPLTSGLLGIASTLNPQVGSAQPIVIPTPIGELDVIALYIASIATGSIALAITNTARPWHIGLYGNAGGLGPTQGHPLSSATDEPEPHWGPFGGAAPVSAGVGHAALVGALSVPHSWTTAAPEIQLAVQATPTFSSSAGADPTALNGMPAGLLSGMALASLAARGTTGGGGTRSGTSTDGQEDGRKPPVVVIREQPPPGNPPR